MRKNCLCGRSLTMSVAQPTLVATTSLLPPLKVQCTNGVVRLCKLAYQSPRLRHSIAITGGRFASLGDAPFYRGSVNTGDGDTALIFASDAQLELLRSCRLMYVDATFGWCLRYFISHLRVFVQHTDHSYTIY